MKPQVRNNAILTYKKLKNYDRSGSYMKGLSKKGWNPFFQARENVRFSFHLDQSFALKISSVRVMKYTLSIFNIEILEM